MKFIDEYDGVLRLHQLLHDGFQALFKLATVLGAGHDERQVESQDALICQERRNFAIGDALRQSFDDGSLTYPRLADQYWVVLGAERSFAHAYETGGMRRTHLCGRENILKRVLIHVGGLILSLVMRQL